MTRTPGQPSGSFPPLSAQPSRPIGGRIERREVNYRDSAEVSERFSDQYWTGNASLEWQLSTQQSFYATLARGVKAGGVNASLSSTLLALVSEIDVTPYASRTRFNEEIVLNRELGWRLRSTDGRLRAALAVFSMDVMINRSKGHWLFRVRTVAPRSPTLPTMRRPAPIGASSSRSTGCHQRA